MPNKSKVVNVLYLTPGHHVLSCKTSVEASLPQYRTVEILLESDERCRRNGRLDLLKCMETVTKIIEEENVDIVIGISDNFSLLQAALVDMYPDRFQGPSLLSNFLTMDKYYSRLILDPPESFIPFHPIDISRPLTQEEQDEAIENVGLPAIIKPRTGTRSTFLHKITWGGELLQYVESIRGDFGKKIDDVRPFLARYLPISMNMVLPLAFEEGLLVEEFVDTPLKASADGLIFNKEIVHWAISDWRYWPSKPQVPQMLLLPSQLPQDVQQRVWDVYDHVATKLIHYGYDNTFFNIQFFICPTGEVKIIEVNGRGSMVQCFCFREVLTHGDMVEAHLKLAQGIRPHPPVFTGKHAAYVYFQSMISGRAGDIVDYNVARSTPYCIIRLKPDDVIEPLGDEGARIGQTTLIGDSRESILRQHHNLYQKLFKKDLLGVKKD